MLNPVSRRAAIVGAFASTTFLAVPAIAATHPEETIAARFQRLTEELAAVLAEQSGDQFRLILQSDGNVWLKSESLARHDEATLQFLNSAPPEELIQHHAMELAKAAAARSPGAWRINTRNIDDIGVMFLIRDRVGAPSTFVVQEA